MLLGNFKRGKDRRKRRTSESKTKAVLGIGANTAKGIALGSLFGALVDRKNWGHYAVIGGAGLGSVTAIDHMTRKNSPLYVKNHPRILTKP